MGLQRASWRDLAGRLHLRGAGQVERSGNCWPPPLPKLPISPMINSTLEMRANRREINNSCHTTAAAAPKWHKISRININFIRQHCTVLCGQLRARLQHRQPSRCSALLPASCCFSRQQEAARGPPSLEPNKLLGALTLNERAGERAASLAPLKASRPASLTA